jgi:hypothetical protein
MPVRMDTYPRSYGTTNALLCRSVSVRLVTGTFLARTPFYAFDEFFCVTKYEISHEGDVRTALPPRVPNANRRGDPS